jgi:hypothetical protein
MLVRLGNGSPESAYGSPQFQFPAVFGASAKKLSVGVRLKRSRIRKQTKEELP